LGHPVPNDGLTRDRRFYLKHRERRNTERVVWRMKKYYGVTEAAYWELFQRQGEVCAICSKPGTGRRKFPLDVDHSHLTGKVRGLLCVGCNTRLHALENAEWRSIAEQYLALGKD